MSDLENCPRCNCPEFGKWCERKIEALEAAAKEKSRTITELGLCHDRAEQELEQARNGFGRLEAALKYIMLLAQKKSVHLGRPRPSDRECIFCMAYFALNDGAYGHTISREDYEWAADELTKALEGEQEGINECE